ncbi:hypothetical protein GCM10009527_036060 [Actinomadura nitritigenes]|uniref:Uncharacterized protein n=1 Tax=Actinomadura nitritigenes TaxID=134602 RepID=A0ABS3QYT0_9ACTN|nr:hypothetical protein [Actinomadura nitritigenes]MBO2438917.1 hypothetical protein [Actinomadura nitritigenes]
MFSRIAEFTEKINVAPIFGRHFRTLYNNRTQKISKPDLLLFIGVPLGAVIATYLLKVRLGTTGSFLAAIAALAAFLFALLILMLQMAAQVATSSETGGVSTRNRKRVKLLREISVNVAYCSLLCIIFTAWLALGDFTIRNPQGNSSGGKTPAPQQPTWYAEVTYFFLVHLLLTLLMVVKRTLRLVDQELDNALVSPERE